MARQGGQDTTPDTTPVVSGSQVFAAGLASTGAAFVTSRFGVAGTILGAALTTMIITGGAAILKAYLESMTGSVRKVPQLLRARRERRKAARYAEPPEPLPDRPDLRDNFVGRMRAAVGWFSRLPLPARRSILMKGLIGAAIAFVISMGAIYVVERGIGNSLSCGLWGTCPEGATPGIHLGSGDGAGAGSTIGGGRASQSGGAVDRDGGIIGSDQQGSPLQQQDPASQQRDRGYQPPASPQQNPSGGGQNVAPGGSNAGEPAAPVEPVEPEVPSEEPVQPVPGQPTPQQAPSE